MNVYRVSYVENGNEAGTNVLAGDGSTAATYVASLRAKALIVGTSLLAENVVQIPVAPVAPPPQPVIAKKPVSDKVSG